MNLVWLFLTVILSLLVSYLILHSRKLSKQLEAVEKDRTRFRLLWKQMPDIVTEIDLNGYIVDINHPASGFDKSQVLGTPCEQYLTPEVVTIFRDKMRQAISTRVTQQYEMTVDAGTQGTLYFSNQLVPIICDGELHSLMAISSDISEQVKAREVLRLERDQAKEANIAKSRFLASMSHEIRTPMNGLLGMASLLEQTDLSSEQHSFLKVIQTSSDHLLAIVNDILDLSKIEANKLAIEEEVFSLRSMVEDLLSMVSAKAKEKSLVLQSFTEDEVPDLLLGDAIRIRQILMNFLTNAIKFTERGHVLLRVVRVEREQQRVCLRFTVEDTGLGIEANKAMHLFDEYSFAHGRLSTMVGGTGLGLSICQRLANLMNGQVGVVSAPGVGSNFWLDLSLATVDDVTLPVEEAASDRVNTHSLWLVDEVPVNRALLVSVGRRLKMPLQQFGSVDDVSQAINRGESLPEILVISRRLFESLPDAMECLVEKGVRIAVTFSEAVHFEESSLRKQGVYGYWDWPISEEKLRSMLLALSQCETQPERLITQYRRTGVLPDNSKERLQHKRILLAEDNPVNQKVATQMLTRMGCDVRVATTGSEAVELYQAQAFDLILMDCHMPEMDGLDATRAIRKLEGETHIPVLALSADVMAEQKKACLDAGMNDYLAKPIRVNELKQALLKFL